MTEQALQTKIIKWLTDNGFYSIKTIVSNKKGVPDIVGVTPGGRFYAIEVKFGKNKPSPLQLHNIAMIKARVGIAFVAYDLDTVEKALGHLAMPQGFNVDQESDPNLL